MQDTTRGIHELYSEDRVAADEILWSRKTDSITRRGFLAKGGLAAMSTAISLTDGELKATFELRTYQLQLECGGNGRSEFVSPNPYGQ